MSDQEMKLRFFGLHLGCPLVRGGSRGTLQGVSIDRFWKGCAQTVFDGLTATVRIDNCHLLLKPLSEITDEGAIECAKVFYPDGQWKIDRALSDYIATVLFTECDDENVCLWIWKEHEDDYVISLSIENEATGFRQFEMADFLRSKGYCLPYMGKDPFKEGWAVPATVNQPQGINL